MTDDLGSVSYSYDQLSRLTSESRYFGEFGASFAFSYQYNLAGELTRIRGMLRLVTATTRLVGRLR